MGYTTRGAKARGKSVSEGSKGRGGTWAGKTAHHPIGSLTATINCGKTRAAHIRRTVHGHLWAMGRDWRPPRQQIALSAKQRRASVSTSYAAMPSSVPTYLQA